MQESKPHSGLALSSFAISVVGFLIAFAVFAVAGYLNASVEGGIAEESPQAVMIGLIIIAVCFSFVLGIALGIAGVVQDSKSRVFGIIGIVCNGGALLLVAGLLALGLQL
jgi:hypothetical protein